MKTHPDQAYLEGLLHNDSEVVQTIYEKFAPKIIRYICFNNGDKDQAKDIIQDALIAIYKQAKSESLKLTCPFEAYFFMICKRKWLNELKGKCVKETAINELGMLIHKEVEEMVFSTFEFEEKERIFQEKFEELGDTCRELLLAAFSSKSMGIAAESMGISYGYARKKKMICMTRLISLIRKSELYTKTKNNS